ncbi:flagellar motor switch protein FliN [Microvirga flavescens]|uniref:flagellar motor switch protein FliN n=1 Tax=Microvirga flavescens TaxID=2249811 RepID=UPI000DD811D5|nr:flagellar motor switch protein FliN [Microvirga flavescens]
MTEKPKNGKEDQAHEEPTWHNEALFSKTESGDGKSSETIDSRLGGARNLDSILRIPVLIQVVLGSATMPVANLMKLGRGAIVPLDHRVGEPVDVVVNGRVIARGEVVVVEDDNSRFGVSLTEIVGPPSSEFNS